MKEGERKGRNFKYSPRSPMHIKVNRVLCLLCFNFSIVDSLNCVNFRCPAKWLSCVCTYVCAHILFSDSFPLYVIKDIDCSSPVIYGRSLFNSGLIILRLQHLMERGSPSGESQEVHANSEGREKPSKMPRAWLQAPVAVKSPRWDGQRSLGVEGGTLHIKMLHCWSSRRGAVVSESD